MNNNPIPSQPEEQVFLNRNMNAISAIWSAHQLDPQPLANLIRELNTFSVRLPLVGAFSAGKSSLINFLLQERLLAANVNPETSLPAEVHYAATSEVTLNQPGKAPETLARESLRDRDFSDLPENSWLNIAGPFPPLEGLDCLTLVDMPGWSSGIDRHSQAIDNYLWRSSAWCLVVSADEGGLKESLKRIIEELCLNKKPLMLVVTKADKKTPAEVDNVCRHLRQEIASITDEPLLSVCVTRRTDTLEFEKALRLLAPLNAHFFHQRVGVLAGQLLGELQQHLDTLRNSHNFSIDEIKEQREALIQEQQTLSREISQIERQLRGDIPSVEQYIVSEFEQRLKNQLETLSSALLNGGDVNGPASAALRMAWTSGVENKLKPLIKNKLHQLEQRTSEQLNDVNFSHRFTLDGESGNLLGSVLSDLFPLLLNVLAKTPWLAPVAMVLKSLLSAVLDNVSQELAREEQREKARRYVLNDLIPDCTAKVGLNISTALLNTVDSIMNKVREDVDRKIEGCQHSLRQLEQKLASAQSAEDNTKARLAQEYDEVSGMIKALKGYAHV